MGERSKSIRYIQYAALAALVLHGDRYVPEPAKAPERIIADNRSSQSHSISDSDFLSVCRQPDKKIDSACATDQAQKAVVHEDTYATRAWQTYITDPVQQLSVDRLILERINQAVQIKDLGACAAWSTLLTTGEAIGQLPACE